MKIEKTGIVVARSNGVMSLGGWTVDGYAVEGEFSDTEMKQLVAHAKEHGTYFESDILSLTDVMRLMKAKHKHGKLRIQYGQG